MVQNKNETSSKPEKKHYRQDKTPMNSAETRKTNGAFSFGRGEGLMSFAVAVFFVFTILFYGPLALYLENAEELWFTLKNTLQIMIPVSLAGLALIMLLAWMLPRKVSNFLIKLLFGVTLAMYIQGTLINTSYGGVLNGQAIRWEEYTLYGIMTLLLWVVCIILPFVLTRIRKVPAREVIVGAALFFTAIQIPALVVEWINYTPSVNSSLVVSEDKEFELAPKDNIVIFAMDTMDEALFQKYLAEHPETAEQLNGFIHYDNTLASGATTIIGIPSMLTGQPFKRESTYSKYITDIWSVENPLSRLNKAGYDVRVYTESTYLSPDTSSYIKNIHNNDEQVGSYGMLAKKLYKLTGYKFSQHFFKRLLWFNTAEFSEAQVSENRYGGNDGVFYKNFKKNGISVSSSDNKAFRFYHLNGAHSPYRLNRDGVWGDTTSIDEQVEGVYRIVLDYLSEMKTKGLYDSSTIVLTCDHGYSHVAEYSSFLYKAPYADFELKTSHAPVSVFDLPVLMNSLAGVEDYGEYGMDFTKLEESEVRERHFFYNSIGTSKIIIDEYMTTGNAGDPESLILVKSHDSAAYDMEPYVLGTKLLFNQDATGNQYVLEGFGRNTGVRSILYGPYASMSIPFTKLPKEETLHVSIVLHAYSQTGERYEIKANGETVESGTVDKALVQNGLHFEVPVSSFDENNTLLLEFLFPDSPQEEMDKKVNTRTQTLSFIEMTIN